MQNKSYFVRIFNSSDKYKMEIDGIIYIFNGSRRNAKKWAQKIRHRFNLNFAQGTYENMAFVA